MVLGKVNTRVVTKNNTFVLTCGGMNYGQRLKAARLHKKLSQDSLAKISSVGQGSISKIERGDQDKSAFDIELSIALDVSPIWLKSGQEKYEPNWISSTKDNPKGLTERHHNAVNDIQAGYYEDAQPPSNAFTPVHYANIKLSAGVNGFEVDYHDEALQPIFFRHDWLSSKGLKASKLIACQITGDSMEPRLYSGDSVVINTESSEPIDGKVFAVNYEGELVIKRLYRDNGNWYLRSDNPDKTRYSDKTCASDICIMIGEVVHRQSTEI